ALWALAGAVSVAGVLWLTGEIAGRVFEGTWPRTPFPEMGHVLVRLHAHPGNPGTAWPPPERKVIPGAAAFYATLAALLVPLAAAALLVMKRRVHDRAASERAGARWARARDLQLLRVSAPQPGRLTLGRVDGRLIAAEPRQSVIVIGPTQTGKTTGFAIPAILEWQGPVLATSVKSDLLRDTLAARTAIPGASVWIYDPTRTTGLEAAGRTPLAGCET